MVTPPLIGITMDNRRSDRTWLESPLTYSQAVVAAGGTPVMLAQQPELAQDYLTICDGFLFTGGDDPCMELLGRATHPNAIVQARSRQTFEWALLEALESQPDKPVLGICLGMQMMALYHGGDLHQHLPDLLGEQAAQRHLGKNRHAIHIDPQAIAPLTMSASPAHRALLAALSQGQMPVVSSHHQAVSNPGSLAVVARADDDLLEMILQPERRFYVGVQWHPELGEDESCNQGLFKALVQACWPSAKVPAAAEARSPA